MYTYFMNISIYIIIRIFNEGLITYGTFDLKTR